MRALLVAVNAKYIHSNLGIYSLCAYSRKRGIAQQELWYAEYTINQNTEEIIRSIYEQKPDVIGFSCYIWNIEQITKVARELKKILPQCTIWYGGPEVSYDARCVLEQQPWVEGVIIGEGEVTLYELLSHYQGKNNTKITEIRGLAARKNGQVIFSEPRESMALDDVVFPYENLEGLEHRIIYYESSRGCPYGCSYCLSSVEKSVRFRNMELVKMELQFFLDQKVAQVKFVDRTFNCNAEHTMEIWRYIYEHDNGITNFHFELSAELLTEEEIAYVKRFRPGLVQFEIGVQTTNTETLCAIRRKTDMERLRKNVEKIRQGRNIHQHLDLIAGLPYEDLESFRQSFNEVYEMKPNQLQLGFLKVLKGSPMALSAKEYGLEYTGDAPYEVLQTKWISYEELCQLKIVEEMVERFYNSMQFEASIQYMVKQYHTPYEFYETLGRYFKEHGLLFVQQSRMQNYEILYAYAQKENLDTDIIRQLLVYDLYARENVKKEPAFLDGRVLTKEQKEWQRSFYCREEEEPCYLKECRGYSWKQLLRRTHMEWFSYDILQFLETGQLQQKNVIVLFHYEKRNPLTNQGIIVNIERK